MDELTRRGVRATAPARVDVVEHFRRAVDVTAHLAARGVPVVGPSDEVPAGPFTHDGMAVGFAAWVPHDPTWVPTDFALHLAELHTELRSHPGPLPGTSQSLIIGLCRTRTFAARSTHRSPSEFSP